MEALRVFAITVTDARAVRGLESGPSHLKVSRTPIGPIKSPSVPVSPPKGPVKGA